MHPISHPLIEVDTGRTRQHRDPGSSPDGHFLTFSLLMLRKKLSLVLSLNLSVFINVYLVALIHGYC